MSTTTDLVPYKMADERFGALIEMPKMYASHKLSADNAVMFTNKIMKSFESIPDLTKADAAAVEAILKPVRELRVKLEATEKKINTERKPHTQKMDEVGGKLIENEKTVAAQKERTKKAEDTWQLEILRREKAAVKDAADKLAVTQATITRKASIATAINAQFGSDLTSRIVDMHKKFYSFADPAALTAWIGAMKSWVPLYNPLTLTNAIQGDAAEIQEVKNQLVPGFLKEYDQRCTHERNNLVDMLAGRIEQLKAGAGSAEVVVDVDKFSEVVTSAVADMNQSVSDDAQKASINASFDSAAVPVVVSGGGKGKVVKKKYKADSMEALQAIMQSWVQNNMRLHSIEELNKKLSFMRTAADVRLNEGSPVLEAKGLSVVDDISTRSARPVAENA